MYHPSKGADLGVTGYPEVVELEGANAALKTFGVDLEMVPGVEGADIVHSHTWYANLAGHLSGMLYGIPHILSAHSLKPMRPWKAEQLLIFSAMCCDSLKETSGSPVEMDP